MEESLEVLLGVIIRRIFRRNAQKAFLEKFPTGISKWRSWNNSQKFGNPQHEFLDKFPDVISGRISRGSSRGDPHQIQEEFETSGRILKLEQHSVDTLALFILPSTRKNFIPQMDCVIPARASALFCYIVFAIREEFTRRLTSLTTRDTNSSRSLNLILLFVGNYLITTNVYD